MPRRPDPQTALRQHLLYLLGGGGAHLSFEKAVAHLPASARGRRPDNMPHSPWEILEHLRLAQWDILEFSRHRGHVSPDWPKGYWPRTSAPPSASVWSRSIRAFRKDLFAMQALVKSPRTDLHAPIPWGDGQTILREALLVADHNAYHLGQLVLLRRLLGIWSA